jgi:alpha-tubulin suppressor-like RCC1 family protein
MKKILGLLGISTLMATLAACGDTLPLEQKPASNARLLSLDPKQLGMNFDAGGNHSLARTTSGTLLSWGSDDWGQLGDDDVLTSQPIPVAVNTSEEFYSVSAGSQHSLALKTDGTVLSWGRDFAGQLGNDTDFLDQATPVLVENATEVVAISAGGFHSLALRSDGTVLSWGWDYCGQVTQATPVIVPELYDIVAVSAGGSHSLALNSRGEVFAWGCNDYWQLGNQGSWHQPVPTQTKLKSIVAVSAGGQFSLALRSDGSVLSWGRGDVGQLGNGGQLNYSRRDEAQPVLTDATITTISAGYNHVLALTNQNTILAWGADFWGALGDDSATTIQTAPIPVYKAEKIVAVSAGDGYSMALRANGTLLSWGADHFGQLGNDTNLLSQYTPVSVQLGSLVIPLP